eukprot:scaffold7023_cov151-Skeletonema_marinoi.AAC.2
MECAKSVIVEIENYTVPEGSLRWLCSGHKEEDGVHKWTHDSKHQSPSIALVSTGDAKEAMKEARVGIEE